jgi:hypothetical protein
VRRRTSLAACHRCPLAARQRPAPAARLRAFLAAALVLATAGGVALARDYFPAGPGFTWTYSSGETQIMSGPRDFGGTSVMVLTHYLGGVPVSEDYLTYSEESGVHTLGTASGGQVVRFDPPLLVYAPSPLEIGDSWQSTTQLGDVSLTLTAEVLGLRGVQTPAGRFNALQIRQRTLTSSGAATVLDIYFVPGVGIVRFVTQDGTTIDLIDLVL